MFCHIMITQFHKVTNNFNRWIFRQKYQWPPIWRHACHMPIMAVMVRLLPKSVIFCECSPIDSLNKIMKLCDYDVAKNSKFIVWSLIFIGCIVFIHWPKWLVIWKCLHFSARLETRWFSQVGRMIQIFFSLCTIKLAYCEWLSFNANPDIHVFTPNT